MTDGSEDSLRAARAALALAGNAGAELHVGQAAPSASGATAARPPLPGEPPGYAERQARKLLDGQADWIRENGGTVAGDHLKMGRPAAEVISLGVQLGADMIVVGSGRPHRHSRGSYREGRPLPGPRRARERCMRTPIGHKNRAVAEDYIPS